MSQQAGVVPSSAESLTQDPERWIPLPPDEWKSFIHCHSGNRPEGGRILIEALKSHHSQAPAVSLMEIQRGPSHGGRRGGRVAATCGSCSSSGTFQKVAEHIVSHHLNLSLWCCDSCSVTCARQYDLTRHRELHGITRPRKAKKVKKKNQGATASTSAATAMPPAPSLSPSLGPARNGRNRSRGPSNSQPYPSSAEGDARVVVSHNSNRTSVSATLVHGFITGHSDIRGRLPDCHPLAFNAPDGRNVALPRMAPPSIREPSPANGGSPWRTPSYVSEGPSQSSLGNTSFDPIDLSNPSRPSASPRQFESFPLLDNYPPSNFLSPNSLTLATSPMWSPSPPPVHRVTTPIPSRAGEPTTPRGSPYTQNLEHFSSPMLSPHLSPQRLALPPLFTSYHGFYPPSAQTLAQPGRGTLSPALSNADVEWDSFGLPPFSDDDHGSSFGLSDTLSDFELNPGDQALLDELLDGLFPINDLFNE